MTVVAGLISWRMNTRQSTFVFLCIWTLFGVAVVLAGSRICQLCKNFSDALDAGSLLASLIKSVPKLGNSKLGKMLRNGSKFIVGPAMHQTIYMALTSLPPLDTIYWLGCYLGVTIAGFVVVPASTVAAFGVWLFYDWRKSETVSSDKDKASTRTGSPAASSGDERMSLIA